MFCEKFFSLRHLCDAVGSKNRRGWGGGHSQLYSKLDCTAARRRYSHRQQFSSPFFTSAISCGETVTGVRITLAGIIHRSGVRITLAGKM
jgi:hypothetical protein